MAVTSAAPPAPADLDRSAPPSPAGPWDGPGTLPAPPVAAGSRLVNTLRFGGAPLQSTWAGMRRYGDVYGLPLLIHDGGIVVTNHPDHIKSLFTANPDDAPSINARSPLRPLLGPDSVLTAIGPRHMRQRKLLLPPFHGDAVARYARVVAETTEREIDSWPLGRPFALAPRMSAITLDVIMDGIFGIGPGEAAPGSPEFGLRTEISRFLRLSTRRAWQLVDIQHINQTEARGVLRYIMGRVDREMYAVIANRRRAVDHEGTDVMSLLLRATDDEGRALTDEELRAELLTLVLAGHETTANSLAWTFERLLRTPAAYDRLREVTRSGEDSEAYVEATIHEGMRVRPVIPMVGRQVQRPWRFGDHVVPAGTVVGMSIIGVQHREDVYPDPFTFRPERFLGRKPGTYTWIPFGGGIRRCLGAALAMAEQKVVLEAIARRTDMVAPTQKPEQARMRNVTVIPSRGGEVVVANRR
jgi:cytochrome P450